MGRGGCDAIMNTEWCVISGPPCSGKTTLINELEALGYPVVHEVARSLITSCLRPGMTPKEIQARKSTLQHDILRVKLEIENGLSANQTTFFDRGIPDSIAYFKLAGLDPGQVIDSARIRRYKHVFFLEALPYRKDSVRIEETASAATLAESLEKSYRIVGYEPIRIPCVSTEERLRCILEYLSRR